MGREAKRVPLHFKWPQWQRWEGYEPPYGQQYEPPEGPGWQMWSTTEEAPMSPVFKKPEMLATWLDTTKASAFADQTASYDEWLAIIKCQQPTFTGVMNGKTGKIRSGVTAAPDDKSLAAKLLSKARFRTKQEKDVDRER